MSRSTRSWIRRGGVVCVALVLGVAAVARAEDDAGDTGRLLDAVVRVRATAPADARSTALLGIERVGSGVIVRRGYVATIGYLVNEAESIEVTGAGGRRVAAVIAGYDHASGIAVLRLRAPLAGTPLVLGDSAALRAHDPALVASFGGDDPVTIVQVVARRPYTSAWEYLLESAIYTYPPVLNWSGAALIGDKGELLGLGSLLVPDAGGHGSDVPGNVFVPVDLLAPALDALIRTGRAPGPARPWLGITAGEVQGTVYVSRLAAGGPAERAGLRQGDVIVGVGRETVSSLEDFYRKLWARGAAGVAVPLTVMRDAKLREVTVRSADRTEYDRAPRAAY